jgi:hypothetical protein
MTRPTTLQSTRWLLALGAVALLLVVGARSASAQEATTLTIQTSVAPAADGGRFDLLIGGVVVLSGAGDGATTGPQPVAPGTVAVAEAAAAGTSLSAYRTTLTCVDDATTLIAGAELAAAEVTVAAGHAVVCTFSNVLLVVTPPTIAPPFTAQPILLPPAFVRGTAILRGIEGCTAQTAVVTRVIGRNIARVVFVRDGRIVKRIKAPSLSWREFQLRTPLPAGDLRLHTITARAYFVSGATPRVKAMVHRFSHCRASAVVG